MTDDDNAYECRIRFSGRMTHPIYLDHSSGTLNFDYINLAAYHNGWDSYATIVFPAADTVGIAGSYCRGHDDSVWQVDRSQQAIASGPYADAFDFFCR